MDIQLKNVSFSYADTHVLQNCTWVLPPQGMVCLFGASGCGKTTVLRLLAGLEQPQAGEMTGLEGVRTAMVFQENRLLPWLSVYDNLSLVHQKTREVENVLSLVGLSEVSRQFPHQLSGGMQRRVALARALTAQADLLLLDEPFAGLDEPLWQHLAAYVREVYAQKLVILVTHNPLEYAALGAQVFTVDNGTIKKE